MKRSRDKQQNESSYNTDNNTPDNKRHKTIQLFNKQDTIISYINTLNEQQLIPIEQALQQRRLFFHQKQENIIFRQYIRTVLSRVLNCLQKRESFAFYIELEYVDIFKKLYNKQSYETKDNDEDFDDLINQIKKLIDDTPLIEDEDSIIKIDANISYAALRNDDEYDLETSDFEQSMDGIINNKDISFIQLVDYEKANKYWSFDSDINSIDWDIDTEYCNGDIDVNVIGYTFE